MKPYSEDTSPEAHCRHVENVRAMTPAERVQVAFDMSARAMAQAIRVIQNQYPGMDEMDARIVLLERLYGKELADKVRLWWAQRQKQEAEARGE